MEKSNSMRLLSFVEGHGEVEALPILLRRLRSAGVECSGGTWDPPITFLRPWRIPAKKLLQKKDLQSNIRKAMDYEEPDALLVVIDSEDFCPVEQAEKSGKWASEVFGGERCFFVFANREYESWFLASMESLGGKCNIRKTATSHQNPESVRDAKGKIEEFMEPRRAVSYKETVHQAKLSAAFDLSAAYAKCRSFQKMVKTFGECCSKMGHPIANWPPFSCSANDFTDTV